MGFVDGEQRNAATFQQREEALGQQALGRNVEQIQVAGQQGAFHALGVFCIQGGIEELGAYAELAQGLDLILHQRDQRRDHDADAVA